MDVKFEGGSALQRADWLGAALFIASLTIFLVSLSWVGSDSYADRLVLTDDSELGWIKLSVVVPWNTGSSDPWHSWSYRLALGRVQGRSRSHHSTNPFN